MLKMYAKITTFARKFMKRPDTSIGLNGLSGVSFVLLDVVKSFQVRSQFCVLKNILSTFPIDRQSGGSTH